MKKIIYSLTTASLILLSTNQSQAGIRFSGNKATLGLSNTNSKLILNENITGFDGTLKLRSSLADNVKSTTSETITFADGAVQIGSNQIDFSGGITYDPQNSANDLITLNNGNILSVSSGSTITHDIEVAASATAEIIGTPSFASNITEITVNGGATLKLGIQHKLTTDISLAASSILELTDDLALKDSVKFTGAGISGGTATIDLKLFSLEIGSSNSTNPWTGTTTFKRAQDIQLNGPVALDGTWSFVSDGTDKESVLNGNGNILDLSNTGNGGGRITVGSDHTLYISDVHIKGFGVNANTFNLFDHATTPGTVVLSNVTIELAANYVHDQGSIKIRGDNCRMIVGKPAGGTPYTFTVDVNTSALSTVISMFEIDGQVLIYETLGGDNTNPFLKDVGAGPVAITLPADYTTTGGVIRSAISDIISVDYEINSSGTTTLTSNYDLFTNTSNPGVAPTNRIVVNAGATPTVTIDGGNYIWQFPSGTTKVLKIAAGVTVTLQNVILRDFSLDNVEFVHATTSILQFGDGVLMELPGDQVLPITNNGTRKLTFVGNATLQGNGHTVTLAADQSIAQTVTGKTLTLQNLNVKTTHATGLACSNATAKIVLKNSKLIINQANFTFATGSIDVEGKSFINSAVTNATAGTANFDLTTSGTLRIKTGSQLRVNRGVNLRYRFDASADPVPSAGRRYRLYFEDPSSTLFLDGCSFDTTDTPITFVRGNLIIDNKVQLNADYANGAGFETEFGTNMNVEVLAGGNLNIDGNVKYVATSLT